MDKPSSYCDVVKQMERGNVHVHYHDKEYGFPILDDNELFARLILEINQAGLSWTTILNKKENFYKAFDNFNIDKVASYKSKKVEQLLNDAGIIRNRLKIEAAINNAKLFLQIQKEFGSFDKFIWSFVNGKPIINHYKEMKGIPPKTKISDAMSEDLGKRGFKFRGSTICYAFMQAVGMVDDHIDECWRKAKSK